MGPPRLHRTALVRQDSYFFEAPEDELQAIVRGLEEAHADFQAALLLLIILLILAFLIFLQSPSSSSSSSSWGIPNVVKVGRGPWWNQSLGGGLWSK